MLPRSRPLAAAGLLLVGVLGLLLVQHRLGVAQAATRLLVGLGLLLLVERVGLPLARLAVGQRQP